MSERSMLFCVNDTPTPDGLAEWLKSIPDQVDGAQAAVCETGEYYREFFFRSLARPEDVDAIQRQVAQDMYLALDQYFRERSGRIYWRIPLEWNVQDAGVVIEYDDNGPDLDFITDRRCTLDKNWKRIACYCRVYRAPHKTAS